jgi:MscS family membrane protein
MIDRWRSRILFIALLLLVAHGLRSQIPQDEVGQSPYHVIYNHLYYLQPDSYQPERAALSINRDPNEATIDQAIMLKEVLDGKGMFIDIHRLPTDSMYFDSAQRAHVYILSRNEDRIYLEKRNGEWSYSRTTISQLPGMYEEIYPLGGALSRWFSGSSWQGSFLGIKTWQYVSLVLLFASGFLFFGMVFFLLRTLGHRFAKIKRSLSDDGSSSLTKFMRLVSLWLTIGVVQFFLPAIHLPPRFNAILIKGLDILQIFFGVFIFLSLNHLIFYYLRKWSDQTDSQMDDQLVPLLERLVEILIWIGGILYVLNYLEVNITALLAGISIGGLAIALAAQDTVKNLFGSVMIFLDKPFKIGDWISFDGIDGVVERVGVRSTRIRTFANSLTYVPNALFAERVIDNMGMRIYRRYKTTVGITYDTPPYLINIFIDGIEEILRNHPDIRKDNFEVALNDFGASSLDIMIYGFFQVPTWTDELNAKHEIMNHILHLADRIGVRFAFPTQTLFIEEAPGQISLTPKKMSKEDAIKAKDLVVEDFKERKRRQRSEESKNLGGE